METLKQMLLAWQTLANAHAIEVNRSLRGTTFHTEQSRKLQLAAAIVVALQNYSDNLDNERNQSNDR